MNCSCRYGPIGLLLFLLILAAQIRGGQGDLIGILVTSVVGSLAIVGIIKGIAALVSLALSRAPQDANPDHPI